MKPLAIDGDGRIARPTFGKSRKVEPIDMHVGSRVRLRRDMLGLSQGELGAAVGLSFQQVQKYEYGANRISASRLHDLSRVLDVPVSFFFDRLDPVRAPAIPDSFPEPADGPESNSLLKPETVELVEAYYAIEAAGVRRCLFALAVALAGPSPLRHRRGPQMRPKSGHSRFS